MKTTGLFINPENHVPTLEEMKQTYAKKHGSILEKVSVLQSRTLLRLIIGENAFQWIHGTSFSEDLHRTVRMIKEKHEKLQAVEYALKEPALVSFMNGVLNYVFPKDLLPAQQRTILIKFITDRILSWHSGTSLLAANESYPLLDYAVIEKEVKKNLKRIWALCNNDKYLAQELLDGITSGLTHFIALYALHTLRSQTKVGLQGDLASFYFIPTYYKIKEKLKSIENGKSRIPNQSWGSKPSENDTSSSVDPPHKQESSNSVSSTSKSKTSALQNIQIAERIQVSTVEERVQRHDVFQSSAGPNLVDDINPLPLKRVKLETVGKTPPKLFPRDRPPDDIPVYDYTKVKRENFDIKFAQMETESRISNSSSSNYVSGSGSASIGEWDEVLRSINADPGVPDQYKVMFRCLVMSNRDLRDHNKILRSQLEKNQQ
ncbi:hypothetical protein RB195_006128 [Necator americanus]|uniref:Uncharacterized protein n=1 Tax=Necator americanus TaxID=51031 RepID=A0ABR1BU56_NECAM